MMPKAGIADPFSRVFVAQDIFLRCGLFQKLKAKTLMTFQTVPQIVLGTIIRRSIVSAAAFLLLFSFTAQRVFAADPPPGTDVLVFTNGDQLTGKLIGSAAGKVNFHSDMAGDVAIDFAKVKEIRSSAKFAVLENGVKPTRKTQNTQQVPQGTLTLADQSIQVHTDAGTTTPPIPVKNINVIVDDTTYHSKVDHDPDFLHGWVGAITAGGSIVEATQTSYTFNGALAFVRAIPDVNWLDPRNRTTADFSGSFGKITDPGYIQPASPGPPPTPATFVPETTVKTAIYHADAERDEYVSSRFYYLGAIAFDHNYSQSLDLQQIYGGGIGFTAVKTAKQTLDLKALVQYERQAFLDALPGENQNLIASTFAANYLLKLPKGMIFNQQLAYLPAWNNLHAYSATELNTFSIPAYKNFSLTLGTLDTYLNNPATALPPVKRNSFQFTVGVTYNLKH